MHEPLQIAVILSSIRTGRFNDTPARWTQQRLDAHGFHTARIDPAAEEFAGMHAGNEGAVTALRARLASADGFVIVTPEYNHSFPGALKSLIDSASSEWQAKPVGFVSYGGISGGLRAVEALRVVFAELHAVTLRDCVSFGMPWNRFDREARLIDPDDARAADRAMHIFCTRLEWWARALRDARTMDPYLEAVA